MNITFLGTGTSVGVPMIACSCEVCISRNPKDKRLRSCVYIKTSKTSLLIDVGPDIRTQLLQHHIDDIDAVLITHYHKDHIGGLDDLRAITMMKQKTIAIYGKADVLQAVQREIPYAFGNSKYKLSPQLELNEIFAGENIKINELDIIPIEVQHGDLAITGFRLGKFTYITDASAITQHEIDKIKGSQHFVINGIRKEKHFSHFSLDEAVEVIEKIKAPHNYITHISHHLGKHDEVNDTLAKHISLAFDGLKIALE